MTAMAPRAGPDHRRAGAGRADQAAARRRTRARGLELLVDTGLADVVLPELPALRMAADEHGQHKDVYAHTLQVLDQAIDLERRRRARPGAALGGAAARHRQAGDPAVRARRAGDLPPPRGRRRAAGPQAAEGAAVHARSSIEDVGQLVFLHLRFYGYRSGEWTDSAVRRYVVDAGPLLPRLHKLVRSDCTTRNKRKAAALSARLRHARAADRRAARAGGAGRDPPGPRRQRDHGDPRHPARARWSARPTSTCSRCGWSSGPLGRASAPRPSCRRWYAEHPRLGRRPSARRQRSSSAPGDAGHGQRRATAGRAAGLGQHQRGHHGRQRRGRR